MSNQEGSNVITTGQGQEGTTPENGLQPPEGRRERHVRGTKRRHASPCRLLRETRRRVTLKLPASQGKKDTPRIIRVGMPLKPPNRSVSANFRASDLALNGVVEITREEFRGRAKILEMLDNPVYFSSDCRKGVRSLKHLLNDSAIATKLRVVADGDQASRTTANGGLLPLLQEKTLKKIRKAIKSNRNLGKGEAGVNADSDFRTLLKSVLETLKVKCIGVTMKFNWKDFHKITLRSAKDSATHKYTPESDAVVYEEKDGQWVPLILFESYSKLNRGRAGEMPPDRTRLIIQGVALAMQRSAPAVVFYLTKERLMETIVVTAGNKPEYCVVGNNRFYTPAGSLDVILKTINIVFNNRTNVMGERE